MGLLEFYNLAGGDYSEVKSRLFSDAVIIRILKKYPLDRNLEQLEQCIKSGDAGNSYIHAHALKGIGLNLGLKNLSESASKLCELLKQNVISEAYFLEVRKAHENICLWISELD